MISGGAIDRLGFSIFAMHGHGPRISLLASDDGPRRACTKRPAAIQSLPGPGLLRGRRGSSESETTRQVGIGQADALAIRHPSAPPPPPDHDAGDARVGQVS